MIAKCMCGTNLIWGGDHSYEDYGMSGEGIVANLTCPNEKCYVELVLMYTNLDDEENTEADSGSESE
jgi:hypothetical protein